MKAALGIFTPSAHVISVRYHGPQFQHKTMDVNSLEWQQLIEPQDLKANYDITRCDLSDTLIQVKQEIAKEHNIVLKLKEMGYVASMLQTGGMNHAGSIEKVDGGYYQFTYNFDGDHVWWLISYDVEEEITDDEPYSSLEEDEFLNYILQLKDLKKLL